MRLALSSAPPAKFTVPLLADIATFSNLYLLMVHGYDGSGALRNKRLPEKSTANERGKFNKLTLVFAMIEGKKRTLKRITTETEDELLARAALALDTTVQRLKEAKCKTDLFQVWKLVGKTGANETTTAFRRLHSYVPQRKPQHRGRKHGAIRLYHRSNAPKITESFPSTVARAVRGKTPAKAKAKARRRYPQGKAPAKPDPPAKQQPAPKRQRRGLSLGVVTKKKCPKKCPKTTKRTKRTGRRRCSRPRRRRAASKEGRLRLITFTVRAHLTKLRCRSKRDATRGRIP